MPKTIIMEPPAIGELTDEIHIDVTLIPDYVRDNLAAATLELIKEIRRDPVLSKRLDERIAARRARERAHAIAQ